MRDIELVTGADRGFVATVEIAPFPDDKLPDVVIWGERVFKRDGSVFLGDHRRPGTAEVPRYLEAFAVVSLTPSPGKPKRVPAPPPPVDRSARTTLHGTPLGEEREIEPATGMQKDYVVLTAEERAKGFVRPVRRSYKHDKCGGVTTMGVALAETYARDPGFYSGTFCSTCRAHFPVGADGQFTWSGTDERVGT